MSFTAISSYLPHGNIWMPVADGRIIARIYDTQLMTKNVSSISASVTLNGCFYYPRPDMK